MQISFDDLVSRIPRVILGKEEQIRLALTCFFAGGHLLIEDIPGIGKTTLARVLSRCLWLQFRRIQCTSNMLPSDILGVSVFEKKPKHSFSIQVPYSPRFFWWMKSTGPSQKLKAPLEAMEENQVTTEGNTRFLDNLFL